jgi:hypothetical protein
MAVKMRYSLRALMIAAGIGPPLIAATCLTFPYCLGLVVYLAALGMVLPLSIYLWRNSAARGRF